MNLSTTQRNALYYLYLWGLIFENPRAGIFLEEDYSQETFEELVNLKLAQKTEMFDPSDLGEQKDSLIDKLVGVEEMRSIDINELKNSGIIYGYSLTQQGKLIANKEIPLAKKIDALALKPKLSLRQEETKKRIEKRLTE